MSPSALLVITVTVPLLLLGTYSINLEDKLIECTFDATDGKVGIKMPFEYDNDCLTLNNHNEELVKK